MNEISGKNWLRKIGAFIPKYDYLLDKTPSLKE
jgi:hypothetical protein